MIKSVVPKINKRIVSIIRIVCNTIHFILIGKRRNDIVINAFLNLYCGKLKHSNFGDDLNYYLFKEITKKNVVNYQNILYRKLGIHIRNISCIGSTLDILSNGDSVIWGTGAMFGNRPLKVIPKQVLAVRGPLTRKYLLEQGVDCPEVYGDPALLLPYIYKPQQVAEYDMGIIPHYVDLDNEYIADFIKREKGGVKLINLRCYNDWHDIVKDVNKCEFIISSSLHGLIVADAYGIPNVWVEFSDRISGNGFKFKDYFASINCTTHGPVKITAPISKKDFLAYKAQWKPITIDLGNLIKACPFESGNLLRIYNKCSARKLDK